VGSLLMNDRGKRDILRDVGLMSRLDGLTGSVLDRVRYAFIDFYFCLLVLAKNRIL